ncbi:unnamed protein product [Linum trigynum]|uniref:Uncharacterized protein n=1 Tax=Linum trigynum TaxID=586398 RepID=A0AAV2GKY9_9ROSI
MKNTYQCGSIPLTSFVCQAIPGTRSLIVLLIAVMMMDVVFLGYTGNVFPRFYITPGSLFVAMIVMLQ